MSDPEFRSSAVRPLECLSRSYELIRGQYWLFFGVLLVNVVANHIVPLVLFGPLCVGSYLCYRERSLGREASFGTLGKGFDSFLPSLVVALIQVGIIFVVVSPVILVWILVMIGGAAAGEEEGLFAMHLLGYPVFLGVLLIVSLAVAIFLAFPFQLIADRGMPALAAIRTSIRAALANFWGLTGLVLLNGLILVLALACCTLPLFFYAPIGFGSLWVAYREVFPDSGAEATPEA